MLSQLDLTVPRFFQCSFRPGRFLTTMVTLKIDSLQMLPNWPLNNYLKNISNRWLITLKFNDTRLVRESKF